MYSASGMANTSASLRSRPFFVFQALASFGSDLWRSRGVSFSSLFISRVGGRGGANRSANLEVGGGNGVCTGATKYLGVPRPGLRGMTPGGMAIGAPGASVGTGTATFATAAAGAGAADDLLCRRRSLRGRRLDALDRLGWRRRMRLGGRLRRGLRCRLLGRRVLRWRAFLGGLHRRRRRFGSGPRGLGWSRLFRGRLALGRRGPLGGGRLGR